MLNHYLYSIETEMSEYSSSTRELFYSYQEAYDNRMKYANWFRGYGNVWINKLDKDGVTPIWRRNISENGDIISEYINKEDIVNVDEDINQEYQGKHVKD